MTEAKAVKRRAFFIAETLPAPRDVAGRRNGGPDDAVTARKSPRLSA